MNANTIIHPKSLIRHHGLIALLSLPVLVYIILFQGSTAKLSAIEIPMNLLIGPTVSISRPASEVSNQLFASSILEVTFNHHFEYFREINTGDTTHGYAPVHISQFIASVEKVAFESIYFFQEKTDAIKSKEIVSTPKKPRPEDRFMPIILKAARKYKVDSSIIKAIIKAESGYNPKAVSYMGARGLMQLMPKTAESLGVKDSFCPEQNILGGVKYFKQLLNQFNGDTKLALAAYNAGSRKVRKYKGVPPFKTTRLYIKKVFEYHQEYQQQIIENG
jgi:transglycosylase-like protein with SLT domain